MQISDLVKTSDSKNAVPVIVAVVIVLFAYYAGEAIGQFFYHLTH